MKAGDFHLSFFSVKCCFVCRCVTATVTATVTEAGHHPFVINQDWEAVWTAGQCNMTVSSSSLPPFLQLHLHSLGLCLKNTERFFSPVILSLFSLVSYLLPSFSFTSTHLLSKWHHYYWSQSFPFFSVWPSQFDCDPDSVHMQRKKTSLSH